MDQVHFNNRVGRNISPQSNALLNQGYLIIDKVVDQHELDTLATHCGLIKSALGICLIMT